MSSIPRRFFITTPSLSTDRSSFQLPPTTQKVHNIRSTAVVEPLMTPKPNSDPVVLQFIAKVNPTERKKHLSMIERLRTSSQVHGLRIEKSKYARASKLSSAKVTKRLCKTTPKKQYPEVLVTEATESSSPSISPINVRECESLPASTEAYSGAIIIKDESRVQFGSKFQSPSPRKQKFSLQGLLTEMTQEPDKTPELKPKKYKSTIFTDSKIQGFIFSDELSILLDKSLQLKFILQHGINVRIIKVKKIVKSYRSGAELV